jgi:putative ABC transport system permease protein
MLVLRNVIRNLPRLAPMVVIIVAVFATMVVGNAVLAASGASLYDTYARLVSGDLSVSPAAETNFTIFGSDQLLVGEYLIQPTLADFAGLQQRVESIPEVRVTAGLVSAAANVSVAGRRVNKTVFGVEPESYTAIFPDLEMTAGAFPRPGEPGVVLQIDQVPGAAEADGPAALEAAASSILGTPALLAGGYGGSFTLREVPVTGVFRYPVDDALLNGVVLTDVDTARALSGYLYGALETVEISAEEEELFSADVDDLFGGDDGEWDALFGDEGAGGDGGTSDTGGTGVIGGDPTGNEAADAGGIDIDALLGGNLSATEPSDGSFDPAADAEVIDPPEGEADRARQTIAGSWNFLLVALHDPADRSAVIRRLESELSDGSGGSGGGTLGATAGSTGYRVRDWYRTVGGNASLVRYLQILFNAGLVFVAVGAAIIATNALVLSVLERTGEIGTMRALGAGRARVALMIAMETLVVVTGSAVVGIALGALATRGLNGAEYLVANRYIAILFGGEPVRGAVSSGLILSHAMAAIVLTAVAVVYPLKKALGVSPREAMAA